MVSEGEVKMSFCCDKCARQDCTKLQPPTHKNRN